MLEFKRARGQAQKQQRLAAILAAADTLLDSHAYHDITMQMLAGEVGFSRANLVHYAETKEDIFLQLYLRDMEGLCARLLEETEGAQDMKIEAFAGLFVAACAEYKNFERVGSLLYSILEVNISAGRLAVHKKRMLACMDGMAARLVALFPFLRAEDAYTALHSLLQYMVGLYPAAHPGTVQREAMCLTGLPCQEVDFTHTLRQFVVVLLHGYKALA